MTFLAQAERLAKGSEIVPFESEVLLNDLEGIDCLIGRGGRDTMDGEPRVTLPYVECVTVMGDDDIRLI